MKNIKVQIAIGYEREIKNPYTPSLAALMGICTWKLMKVFLNPIQRLYIVDRFENRLYDGKENHPTLLK